jgi:hypothetical protein
LSEWASWTDSAAVVAWLSSGVVAGMRGVASILDVKERFRGLMVVRLESRSDALCVPTLVALVAMLSAPR